jgi:hypothetical protein
MNHSAGYFVEWSFVNGKIHYCLVGFAAVCEKYPERYLSSGINRIKSV